MPVQYTSIIEEHRTVRSTVGLFDLSHMGEIEVTGEEAVAFLRYALVSDPGALETGPGAVLDGLRGRRRHHRRPHRLPTRGEPLLGRLQRLESRGRGRRSADRRSWRAATSAPTLEDRSDRIALLAPQGPNAAALVGELTDLDLSSIGNYRSAPGTVAGIECLVARTGYTGEDGFELFSDARRARELWERAHGRRRRARGAAVRARARVTRCASRPACRCTATSSAARRTRSRSISAGS